MYIYSHLDFILAFGFLFALQADMVAIYPLGVSFIFCLRCIRKEIRMINAIVNFKAIKDGDGRSKLQRAKN